MTQELSIPRDVNVAIFGEGGFAGGGDGTHVDIDLGLVTDEAYEKIASLVRDFLAIDKKQFPRGMDVYSYGIKVGGEYYSLYPRMVEDNMPNFPACIRELYDVIDAERDRLSLSKQQSLPKVLVNATPPSIQINHFIAYLTYNNNGDSFHFEYADGGYDIMRKTAVDYTTGGIAVFRLDRVNLPELPEQRAANIQQKIDYYRALHVGLTEEFGHGLKIAMAPESDCSNDSEIAAFCKAMKELDPTITTIVFGNPKDYIPQEEEARLRTLTADWKFEPYNSEKLLSGVNVEPRQSSVSSLFKDGIDYVSNLYRGGIGAGYKVINEVLGIDADTLPINDYSKDVSVVVSKDQAAKIQQIADKAFCKAMGVRFNPGNDYPAPLI